MQKIVPNLWFDTEAEDAAKFYTSLFPNSGITEISHYGEAGPREAGMVLTVSFELDGQQFTAINGGPQFEFDEAVSFLVNCDSQDEIDYFWDEILASGGEEGQCGWIKDRFGLWWQIVPAALGRLLQHEDSERSNRAMRAMLEMKKIDVAALESA
jgi:predicted 3-demethylubiquinone-9 3-methyltransferase (glyoxalase superfamily)